MINYQIDWNKLTENEAQYILTMIYTSFTVFAKCWNVEDLNEVSYLRIDGTYTNEIKPPKIIGEL